MWALLKVIGVDFAILWAVFAFFLNFVPNIGSIIAAVPGCDHRDPAVRLGGRGVSVIIGYLVINSLIGTVIEPRIAGRQLGLSTAGLYFLSLLFLGLDFGTCRHVLVSSADDDGAAGFRKQREYPLARRHPERSRSVAEQNI